MTRSVFTKRGQGLVSRSASLSKENVSKGLDGDAEALVKYGDMTQCEGLIGCPVVRTLCLIAQMTPEQRKYLIGLFEHRANRKCVCDEDKAHADAASAPKLDFNKGGLKKKTAHTAKKGTVCRCGFVHLMGEALGRKLQNPEEEKYRCKLELFWKVCLKPGQDRLAAEDLVRAVKGLVHGTLATKLRLLWALSGFSDELPISQKDMRSLLKDIPTKKLRSDVRYMHMLDEVAENIFQEAKRHPAALVRQCITLSKFIRIAPSIASLKPILTINKQIR